jgi:hypothetical protein
MIRLYSVLSLLFAIVALATAAGCASTSHADDETIMQASDTDPAPVDPLWVAAKAQSKSVFHRGSEICAIGHATDQDPASGQDTAGFAATIALADTIKLSSADAIKDLPHRSSTWHHADGMTHDIVLCITPPTNIASR